MHNKRLLKNARHSKTERRAPQLYKKRKAANIIAEKFPLQRLQSPNLTFSINWGFLTLDSTVISRY